MSSEQTPQAPAGLPARSHLGRGILMAILATMSYALVDTLSKYMVRGYPVTMVVWARYAVPCLLLLAVFAPRRGRGLLRTAFPLIQIGRGLLLMAGTLFIVFAVKAMPLAEAQAISFIHPVLLTLMAVLFLGEKVGKLGWVAVFLGFAGVLIIIRPGGGLFTWAALLPLGMAFTYSSYQLLTRRIAGSESAINSLFYVMLVGALVMSAVLPFDWVSPDLTAALLFALIGMIAGIAHFFMIKALEYAPASLLAPFAYVQLLWVTLLGMAVFGDLPDGVTLIGVGVVVAGGLLVAIARKRGYRTVSR
jgi:drug/metabolite transporter (DMT)-like permease